MTIATRPTPSVAAKTPSDHEPAFILVAAARLAALEGTIIISLAAHPRHTCAHCQETGTTFSGALWRASLAPDCTGLYFLHSACLAPYKAAHGLRSVEGWLPLTHARTRVRSHIARRPAPVAWTANRSAAL